MHFYKLFSFVILIGFTVPVFAQANATKPAKVQLDSISGVVYDAITNKPLSGAQITTQNSKYSAMSDEAGKFFIKFPAYLRTLFVSAPDYNNKEVPVYKNEHSKIIKISPIRNSNYYVDELTNIGSKRRTIIPTAQKSINIDSRSALSLDEEMSKYMASDLKIVTHSGTMASGASMLIRGINSLSANTQPLFVVDGVLTDTKNEKISIHSGNIITALSNLDVNDIQSVTVLKDGTTLYGAKGGNGVVLITTNRGRSMATKISASTSIGVTTEPDVIPMMNADQFRLYVSDLMSNRKALLSISDNRFLKDDPNFIFYNKYHNNTDWSKGVYNNSITQSYNVAVNGGDEVALYNLSVGFADGKSTLVNNGFNRLNARFNSDIKLTSKLYTAFDISYIQSARMLRNDGLDESYNSQINSPGFLALAKSPFLSPLQFANNGQITTKLENYDLLGIANPYAIVEYGQGKSQQTDFNMSVVPSYMFSKSTKLSSRFSYSMNSLSENLFSPMYGIAPYINRVDYTYSYNYVKTQFAKQTSFFSDTRLNWIQDYGFNALQLNAGVRFINDSYKSEFAMGHNTGSDQIKEMSKGLAYKTVGGIDEPSKVLTYYGVFDYGLKDKYLMQAAITAETNSCFGKDASSGLKLMGVSWAVFPSLNAAWIVSSENFMKPLGFVNLFKLRAGFGLSGNDDISSTASRSYFNSVKFSGSMVGLQLYNIANPNVQWETVTKRNIGFDANLFNDRISLSADIYNNTTDNLLVLKNLPALAGLNTYWSNAGKLENKGFEVSLNALVVNTKDLNVTIGGSIAHNKNKILALADGNFKTTIYGAEIMTAVGQSIGQFYGYQTNGVFATSVEASAAGLSQLSTSGAAIPFEAGDVRFVNQNPSEDKIIDEKDKVVIGNSNPDFFGSFNAGIKYKSFGVQCIFNYSYGNDVYNYLRSQLESGSTFFNQTAAMNNRWITEGHQTDIPKSVFGDPKANNRFSDRWVEDGSYLKLKTVELSYELPIKIPYLQGLTFWASANNLWTLTKYLGVDPEFSSNKQIMYQGIDNGLLPQSRSYFAGFKIYL